MSLLDNAEIEPIGPREIRLWIITFHNGDEFVSFNETTIEDEFGSPEDYIVVSGTWRQDQ